MSLPPAMTQADLVEHLLKPFDPLTRFERDVCKPFLEDIVAKIYRSRGNPRTIITPMALALTEGALIQLKKEIAHG